MGNSNVFEKQAPRGILGVKKLEMGACELEHILSISTLHGGGDRECCGVGNVLSFRVLPPRNFAARGGQRKGAARGQVAVVGKSGLAGWGDFG